MRRIALAGCLIAISTATAVATDHKSSYTCGTLKVAASFDETNDTSSFIVDGKTYANVPHVQSGSGAKFEQGEGTDYFMFWEHGGSALLQIGAIESPECTRDVK